MSRPRKNSRNTLPKNLYLDSRRGTYRYHSPKDGTWFSFGRDREAAVDAAHHLNLEFMQTKDLVTMVLDADAITLSDFIERYRTEILPERELEASTLELYKTRFRQINTALGHKAINRIELKEVADFLDDMPSRSSNQTRALLSNIFKCARAKGLVKENPAEQTMARIEKKARKRHTAEGLKAIREHSPQWLKNAIDLALIISQRRCDILDMKFEDVRDGYLYVVQKKTKNKSDAGWLKFNVTPELMEIIERCKDDIDSPFVIHRKPEKVFQNSGKEHFTKIDGRYLSRAFQEARKQANCYPNYKDEEMPGFHEIRGTSIKMYKRAGKDAQKIAGHASPEMTRNYLRDHEDIDWVEVTPDLDISEFTD
ncbi:tyrosine-type recombinase/integrase [Geopseudomonas aromaticivorans]